MVLVRVPCALSPRPTVVAIRGRWREEGERWVIYCNFMFVFLTRKPKGESELRRKKRRKIKKETKKEEIRTKKEQRTV